MSLIKFIERDDFEGFINFLNSNKFTLVEFVRTLNTLCNRIGFLKSSMVNDDFYLKFFITLLKNRFQPSEAHLSLIVSSACANNKSGLYLFNVLMERYPTIQDSDIIMYNALKNVSNNIKFAVQIVNRILKNTTYKDRFVAGECLEWAAENKHYGAMLVKIMLESSTQLVYPKFLGGALVASTKNSTTGYISIDFILEYCKFHKIVLPSLYFRQALISVFSVDFGVESTLLSLVKYLNNITYTPNSETSDLLLKLASNHNEGPSLVTILLDNKLTFSNDAIQAAISKIQNPFVNDRLEKGKRRGDDSSTFRSVRRKMEDDDIEDIINNMEL